MVFSKICRTILKIPSKIYSPLSVALIMLDRCPNYLRKPAAEQGCGRCMGRVGNCPPRFWQIS